jgi:hypothetical protein
VQQHPASCALLKRPILAYDLKRRGALSDQPHGQKQIFLASVFSEDEGQDVCRVDNARASADILLM